MKHFTHHSTMIIAVVWESDSTQFTEHPRFFPISTLNLGPDPRRLGVQKSSNRGSDLSSHRGRTWSVVPEFWGPSDLGVGLRVVLAGPSTCAWERTTPDTVPVQLTHGGVGQRSLAPLSSFPLVHLSRLRPEGMEQLRLDGELRRRTG